MVVFLYVTVPNLNEAKSISKKLLHLKLIACSNIFPIRSMYHWRGKIVDEKEYVMILKTLKKDVSKVRGVIESIHPYKIPCITEISVKPNGKYGKWIKGEVK